MDSKVTQATLALLRILIGWHFFYEGIIKIIDPAWSARPFLEGSRWIFGDVFRWMASGSSGIAVIDFLNAWGLTIIGLALMLGILVRVASWAGVVLLFIYYLAYPPFGGFSYGAPNEGNYLIVNKNLIELVCLIVLSFTHSGEFFGLEALIKKKLRVQHNPDNDETVPGPKTGNRRRELIKSLAGLPFLAGFGGIFLNNLFRSGTDATSGATTPQVTYRKLTDLKGKLPTGTLGQYKMSRLIMGCNLISGYAHARDLIYANTLFKAYNTDQKILETFHLAEMAGINTSFITNENIPIFNKYLKLYGGKMQTICQTYLSPDDFYGDINLAIDNGATALYIQGGIADRFVKEGMVDLLGKAIEYIKKKNYPAGIGGHSLEVIKACEREGIPADFYVKTFHHDKYWSAHPYEKRVEFSVDNKKYADHDLIHDNMFDLFPEETAGFMSTVKKPWLAFKVLAGGAIEPAVGFRYAFENGADFICVGMFDFQVIDNINTVNRILTDLKPRQRPWFA